ncbi:Zinc finger protein-like 1 [Strongyloides ratti]|uniref:Zinc finger protein-like 1 homolog n=1 Tax=Strongyloides ratti TaxID=34506 RepID=A0A090KX68_STRRB|nr:Zinc finger protein-like 1 [Strongyloides ratti]CEF62095.1 Zinc finger protein-like 1 [Strongyloides ratti]
MGLCKCPKRKVTALFCYEHRVNVCEYCMIDNHKSCVVQTYLDWLSDSGYEPYCILCNQLFTERETIRLKCLHLFHKDCLHAREANMPNDTKNESRKCPRCLDKIFPAPNQTSPTVEKLKEWLITKNWGRQGLGLPIDDSIDDKSFPVPPMSKENKIPESIQERIQTPAIINMDEAIRTSNISYNNQPHERSYSSRHAPSSIPSFNYEPFTSPTTHLLNDEEEVKYKKRSIKNKIKYFRFSKFRKPIIYFSLSVLAVYCFVLFLTYFVERE